MAFYDRFIKRFNGFFRRLFRVEIFGEENIPEQTEGLLICCNHTTAFDPFVIGACLKFKIYYLAKRELFHIPVIGWGMKQFGAIPIARGAGDVGAVRMMITCLEENKTMGIFPQGHRNPGVNPRDTKVHAGVGMIVCRTHATVLPVCVVGKDNRTKMFRRTHFIVGKPIPYESYTFPEGETVHSVLYQTVTDRVFDEICRLGEEHPVS